MSCQSYVRIAALRTKPLLNRLRVWTGVESSEGESSLSGNRLCSTSFASSWEIYIHEFTREGHGMQLIHIPLNHSEMHYLL